jgi:hypothetical protein
MKEQITLCTFCFRDYIDAGYKLERDYTELQKDECDKCERMGWVYLIDRD